MIHQDKRASRIVVLPSGRGIMFHRFTGMRAVIGFCGPTDRYHCVKPDTTRYYLVSAGRVARSIRRWPS